MRRWLWLRGSWRLALAVVLAIGAQAGARADTVLPAATPESAGMSSAALARLDPIIGGLIAKGDMPGAVVVIARRGSVVYRKAYGQRALYPAPQGNSVDTIYDLASMTKPIGTATAVMKLVEEGKVRLWDRAAFYDSAFAQHGKSQVTIEELLDHSAGLPSALNEAQSVLPEAQGEAIVDAMPLHFAPGTRFEYCNTCYIELARIVRLVSGMPIKEFDAKELFGPLGLASSLLFDPPVELQARVSPEAQAGRGRYLRGRFVIEGRGAIGAEGHAGLFGTADAVAAYAQMLLNGGELDGVRVLSPATVAAMLRPYYLGRHSQRMGDVRGLGWDEETTYSSNRGEIFGVGGFGHTGSTGCSLWVDPATQTIVVLLTNSAHAPHASDDDVIRLYAKVSTIAAGAITDPTALSAMQREAAAWSAQVAAQTPGFDGWASFDQRLWSRTGKGTEF
ncbi:class A beta-lactamase-related serine hydrolase [bacterium]|nr:MAG: class A beta-lactamase-related serine hydrolase [bacterium]